MAVFKNYKPRTTKRKVYRKKPKVSKAVTRYVKKAIAKKVETKYQLSVINEQSFSTVVGQYNVANLMAPTQGTASNNRVGIKINPRGISIRGNLAYSSTTAGKTAYVRLILIETPQSEIYTALTTELFQYGTDWNALASSQMPVIWAPLNRAAGYKFHWDKVYKLNAISSDGSYSKLVKKWIPISGKVGFDANTTGAGNQSRNFALVMVLAEAGQDVGVGETVEFSGYLRSFFTDA